MLFLVNEFFEHQFYFIQIFWVFAERSQFNVAAFCVQKDKHSFKPFLFNFILEGLDNFQLLVQIWDLLLNVVDVFAL